MGFGPHFVARKWSDDETRDVILTRDLERCWKRRGLGDFAVALRAGGDGTDVLTSEAGRKLGQSEDLHLVDLVSEESSDGSSSGLDLQKLENVEWIGYSGVRDATTTSLPDPVAGDEPLPAWQEMVELRYGVHAKYWGKGVAGEAARAVMRWAASEKGVRRFIAETEKTNSRSGKVLQKMGFRESGTDYWKEPGETEWERRVV